MRRLLALVLVLSMGCRKIDPAPEDLDELLHYLWVQLEEGDDETLAEGLVNLDAAVKPAKLDGPEDGTVSRLSKEEAALVGVTDRNPKDAPGVYLLNRYPCTRPDLEEILTYPKQDVIYDGVYDAYSRDYDGSRADFLDQKVDELTWDVEYTSTILGTTYTAKGKSMLRRVPEIDGELTPWGPVLFARTYMPKPAVFESDKKSQEQDYQLEIYWERESGEIAHVYGMWRQADFGSGFTSEDKAVQRILLNNLASWDDTTAELCETGLP